MSCEPARSAQNSHNTDEEKIAQAETRPPMTRLLGYPDEQMHGRRKKWRKTDRGREGEKEEEKKEN